MPSLQQLRYLVAVADHLHFRRAAETCNVTQPTLSAQIKELELRLGASLVERSRSKVVMTPTGKDIAERGRRILREVAEIHTIAKSRQSVLSSVIRIGVVQTVGSYFLPLVIPELHRTYPKLGLYVREGLPDVLLRSLEDGALDLLFFPLPVNRVDLDSLSLFREPIQVVMPADHRLAKEPEIDPVMLRGETILSLEPGHRLYELVRRISDDYGVELSHDYEGTSLDTLRQMVATGMGLSLMPALYVKSEVAHQDIVVARPFRGTAPSRTIGMVWRKGTSREEEFRLLSALVCRSLTERAPEITVLGDVPRQS
ncbi:MULTISPECIES: hydrogen peroxide-inducible genes activator [Marivita]|uniref:LysR family transcriptional regulator n=2 Tax=Roseobacteraceae TaxID=2854170 RepID=A0A9Q2NP25_9RHOB|nr:MULTISPECIES: hydrogen peroxide-inducible genes activator [Marivita]MCR9167020.1 LysR substrate-binding domain-containing protein [Paracoccaceae bacterium]MBM2319898.1 LysR family transcriptional regulator [Marivita cryptomonadis]MBM2329477.1 LysR family transcriptional regulator [Marivita cryptomonadis]MBM2339065.1 LysR family transcriptional regulator [Marivita cryptomonadis]MBM2343723.1 LysR family transcriptional regulator [Marivita cryptomonadis]